MSDLTWESLRLKEFDALMDQLHASRKRFCKAVEEFDGLFELAVSLALIVKSQVTEHPALTAIEQMRLARSYGILADWMEDEKESEE